MPDTPTPHPPVDTGTDPADAWSLDEWLIAAALADGDCADPEAA